MKNKVVIFCLILAIVVTAFFIAKNLIKKPQNSFQTQLANLDSSTNEIKVPTQKIGVNYFTPIFTFHNVVDNPKKDPSGLTMSTLVFEKKIKDLIAQNYQMVFVSEIGTFLEKGEAVPENMVALTFDDGKEAFYTTVFPLLKKYQVKVSLYIITGVRSKNYLNEEQIKEIAQSGLVEIGSHTVYHQKLSKLSDADQLKELKNSKIYLENLLGKEITTICYPYGDHNQKTKDFAREVGYRYGLNFNNLLPIDPTDLFEINRVGVYPEMNIANFLQRLRAKE